MKLVHVLVYQNPNSWYDYVAVRKKGQRDAVRVIEIAGKDIVQERHNVMNALNTEYPLEYDVFSFRSLSPIS